MLCQQEIGQVLEVLDSTMKTFSINIRDHIRHLWMYLLVVVCFPWIVYFLMIYKWGYYDQGVAIAVIGGGVAFFSIFHLSLHLNYYLHDRKGMFFYNSATGESKYVKGEYKIEFTSKDINQITIFKTKPLAKKRTPILVWDEYNYSMIELKCGKVFKISSLLVFELDKVMGFDNTEIRTTLYPWMS